MADSQEFEATDAAPCTDIVIACCRDEADIMEAFIDFYLDQGFDRICLIDNGSRDGTTERILDHPRGDRIVLVRDCRPGYDMRLLDYHRMFSGRDTRWVFFLDVDEFVLLPGGIKSYAESLPAAVTVLELPTAEIRPLAAAGASPLLSVEREAKFQKEHKVVWRNADVRKIYCGKHDVVVVPKITHRDDRVYIRHYHTRSPSQFRTKLRNRIETDSAMGRLADDLTLFGSEARANWISRSRRLLEQDGWEIEMRRVAGLEVVRDAAVADWYKSFPRTAKELDISPIVPVNKSDDWFCFCMRQLRREEGHTGPEHLVLFYAPGWQGGVLDRPVFAHDRILPARLHSECVLGDAFAARRCDCGYQLASALCAIERAGGGVLVYLRQEGRGVGLFEKIRSLTIDHEDTFRRNELAGLPPDARGYDMAAEILRRLGLGKVRLISGNPAKAAALESAGIETELDPVLPLDRISPEASAEIQAKLNRGYAYTFVANASNHPSHPGCDTAGASDGL